MNLLLKLEKLRFRVYGFFLFAAYGSLLVIILSLFLEKRMDLLYTMFWVHTLDFVGAVILFELIVLSAKAYLKIKKVKK